MDMVIHIIVIANLHLFYEPFLIYHWQSAHCSPSIKNRCLLFLYWQANKNLQTVFVFYPTLLLGLIFFSVPPSTL